MICERQKHNGAKGQRNKACLLKLDNGKYGRDNVTGKSYDQPVTSGATLEDVKGATADIL
jgi:hypothetical protein